MTVAVKPKGKAKNGAQGASSRVAKSKPIIFNRRKYAALLSRALPMVITSEAEYEQTLAELKRLLRKGEAQLALEEERLLDLLSTLAENWEEAHHPIPEAPGYRILQHYMQVRAVGQTDLQPILGSRAVTSAIINGKRAINAEQAKQLGALFSVSPAVFI